MARAKKIDEVEADAPPDDRILARLTGTDYKPSKTLARFHASKAFVRLIRGPVGSGKSTACSHEIMDIARHQKPFEGIRRTRHAIIRNTYGELKDTTVKTWLDWFPEEWFGKFNRSQGEMRHIIKIQDIECEVLFRALDHADDIRKVLSMELTSAWVNEGRETVKTIIDALGDRVGRYPPMREGGATRSGIVIDTNSPDEDHWIHEAEKNPPEGWEFFIQPPGLLPKDGQWLGNPKAENADNLPADYYKTRSAGKREDYIRVYYGNLFGYVQEGKSVWPEYADHLHGAKTDLAFTINQPVYIGIGLGLSLAALFGQKKPNGQWVWLDELAEQGGAVTFAERLSAKMAADFPAGTIFRIFAAKPKDETDGEAEALQILRGRKIIAMPCRENDDTLRREAVAGVLSRLIKGEPALLISPKCKITRKAMSGGYCYAKIQGEGERYHDEPMKNRYCPLAEAAQYMLVGGGEAAYVFHQPKPKKLVYQNLGIV